MRMNPWLTGFYKVERKLSDVIPVLRITPKATEPSTVSVFLSVVKCGCVCRAQTCAHSGIERSTLAKGFIHGWPKTLKNFRIFEHFDILRPYISATVTTRGIWSKSEKNPSNSPIHLSHQYRRISHCVSHSDTALRINVWQLSRCFHWLTVLS